MRVIMEGFNGVRPQGAHFLYGFLAGSSSTIKLFAVDNERRIL